MKIDPRMTRARSALVISQPFFGTLAMHLEIVDATDDPEVDTMATDGKRLYYHRPWLDEITELETRGVIAHEVLHCGYCHHTRRGNRDPRLWNIAADYAINRDLLAAGFTLPKEGVFDEENRFRDMTAERIYEILKREDDQKPKSQQQQGGPAQEFGGKGGVKDAKAPDGGKPEPAQMAAEDREWQVRVRQALNVAAAGKAPAALQRVAKQINHRTVDWRDTLRRFIDDAVVTDYSWMRPNKRMLSSGFILPGRVQDGISKIGMTIDTSGSVDQRALSRITAEIRAAMDAGAVQKLVTISCDTRIYNPQEFEAGDKIDLKLQGGGGTNFAPALQWFEENHPDVCAMIYFTDLYGSFGKDPGCPVLWAVFGSNRSPVPFGERIDLDDAA